MPAKQQSSRVRLRPWITDADAKDPKKLCRAVASIAAKALTEIEFDVQRPQRIVVEIRPSDKGCWIATARKRPVNEKE